MNAQPRPEKPQKHKHVTLNVAKRSEGSPHCVRVVHCSGKVTVCLPERWTGLRSPGMLHCAALRSA